MVVAVKGRMDAVSAPEFERAMTDHIATGANRFVVDCSALEYVSSAGLRSLLTTVKTLRTRDGELVFASLRDVVREVFEIAGFETIFPVFDSTDAAMERW
jgi:anti-anti-sigma factor